MVFMDFTIRTYKRLLNTLRNQGFCFCTFSEFLKESSGKQIMLRHDVDRLPVNSLGFARIQAEAGIRGTYYFRAVPDSWNEAVIKEVAGMGHEIGYHYEDLSFAQAKLKAEGRGRKAEGEELEKRLIEIGIESFKKHLDNLRKIVPVKTICMHGSPMSRWDSRLLWKYYDYRDFGIIGEPYFDVDFDQVLYLTDTGRRWDGESVNIRDKAEGGGRKAEGKAGVSTFAKASADNGQKAEGKAEGSSTLQPSAFSPQPPALFPRFHSTFDIINAAEEGKLPDRIMMTLHPQRWTDRPVPWVRELIWQNVKNVGKYFLVKLRD